MVRLVQVTELNTPRPQFQQESDERAGTNLLVLPGAVLVIISDFDEALVVMRMRQKFLAQPGPES